MGVDGVLDCQVTYSKTTFVTVNRNKQKGNNRSISNSKTTFVTVNRCISQRNQHLNDIQKQHLLLLISHIRH